MTRYRRFAALALCLALMGAFLLPAGAASAPKLTYTQSGSALRLKLQGLGQESVYGVQLELALEGNCTSAALSPASATAYAPPCGCEAGEERSLVTLYLTDQAALNKNGVLDLGTLTLSAPLSPSDSGSRPSQKPEPEPSPEPLPEPEPELPFDDVAEADWFYDEVKYVYDQGMMNGTTAQSFTPNAPTSRAMLVTVLYRLSGAPSAGVPAFPDVPAGQYYADAVGWAAQQAIVNGYENGLFVPDGLLTREQLATILYRYARAMGYNTSARGELNGFADRAAISSYASDAIAWAVGTGLLSGMGDGTISPQGQATRAQLAAVLTRFCKAFVDVPQGI